MNIGEQIRDARKAKGLTQDALAEAMNVSRQAVSHWETNRTMPDAETLLRLSKVLEVGGQAVLGRQYSGTTPWLTERHGYDPTSGGFSLGNEPHDA